MELKVISGGQTGADVAGLWAAKTFGLETGGWAPKGFMTLDGTHPEMTKTFGLKEHTGAYRQRTIANIEESDVTVVCSAVMSAGTRLTINQCNKLGVDHVLLPVTADVESIFSSPEFARLVRKINFQARSLGGCTLNVAGNSTKNCGLAFEFTYRVCYKLFTELGFTATELVDAWKLRRDTWE